jgi:hypothetical protein
MECFIIKKKSKAVPVTGRGVQYGCEMLRIPHCLYNRPTDGGEVMALRTSHALGL